MIVEVHRTAESFTWRGRLFGLSVTMARQAGDKEDSVGHCCLRAGISMRLSCSNRVTRRQVARKAFYYAVCAIVYKFALDKKSWHFHARTIHRSRQVWRSPRAAKNTGEIVTTCRASDQFSYCLR